MAKPNFVRIASGQYLCECVDSIEEVSEGQITEAYEYCPQEDVLEAILDLAKLLEDVYNTGIQVGIREATKRSLCHGG